ncbi:MAG: hypothetical protein ISR48_05715 [Alphaproteobacteria bacterium]|nr:hypothetical protein [Alphaproteobacteria bacterium]
MVFAAAIALAAAAMGVKPGQAGEGAAEESPEESSGAPSFVAGFEALPLMPGLHNVAGSSIVFDTPTGRIVESAVTGAATPGEIKAFYAQSLPQLGWEMFLETEYRREDEVLKLEIATEGDNDGDYVVVHFFLSPK